MNATPTTAVVVLNWRNAADTLDCLTSLSKSRLRVDTIVVDNDSGDGSAEAIDRSGMASRLIKHPRNDGYAGGNNVGIRAAIDDGYEIIVVLNNDTLVRDDALARLVEVLTTAERPTAASPRIDYADGSRDPWFAGGVVDRGMPRHLRPDEAPPRTGVTPAQTLTGCCIAARADVWRSVGLFDESFFLIFEDSDWSARAADHGVTLQVVQESVIQHKVSRSFSGASMGLISTYFFVRNGLRYHALHQKRHLPRFLWGRVVKPVVRNAGGARGGRRFVAWGFTDWLFRRTGNAPARAWSEARRIAGTAAR
ncbi:glycosyltransferase family 2 protein [Kineosporia sp. R_H_3]|uniref:glycosyltransferase family 2 protein n=1 Tax=Kineosporia sp. R_H_3 TaxID=1961848 RepID=UPI000B4B7024|nr:glycosyltransferase family 2 protein [Kineosporia sp. R_H_3]